MPTRQLNDGGGGDGRLVQVMIEMLNYAILAKSTINAH